MTKAFFAAFAILVIAVNVVKLYEDIVRMKILFISARGAGILKKTNPPNLSMQNMVLKLQLAGFLPS
jgi:phosphatidate phosphatase PAH1